MNPAIEHIKSQPEGKKFVIRIENLPRKVQPTHIERLLRMNNRQYFVDHGLKLGDLVNKDIAKIIIN